MAELLDLGRGTTPELIIESSGLDLSTLDVLWITLKQGNYELTKELPDLNISGDTITFRLTQEETLGFSSTQRIYIQLRYLIGDNAYKTNVVSCEASMILKEGVIK